MKRLKYSIIYLLICLTVFFNIERLDFGYENAINIQTAVYVLGLMAVLSVILIPAFSRNSLVFPLSVWVTVYMIYKLVFADFVVGNDYIYLTITEISFLALLILLAYRLAYSVNEFNESVRVITMADVGRHLSSLDEAGELIRTEIKRSRHYERPFSVILVEPNPQSIKMVLNRVLQEAQQTIMNRYALAKVAQVMRQQLRLMDMVFEDKENGRLIILSPEATTKDSTVLASRVESALTNQLSVQAACAAATFPDDGLTFNKLLHEAEAKLQGVKPFLASTHINGEKPMLSGEGGKV